MIKETSTTDADVNFSYPLEHLVITGNILKEYRHKGGIAIYDLTTANVDIVGNALQTSTTAVIDGAIHIENSTIDKLVVKGNIAEHATNNSYNRIYIVTSTLNIQNVMGNSWNRQELMGTAAPTTGTWNVGDIVWNSSPAAAGKIGWVCVTAGTPGTWKAFGAIDA